MKTILKNESIILLLDQVFQQLVKLLHKRTKTLEVTTCNLTIIEKSNKFDKNGSHKTSISANWQLQRTSANSWTKRSACWLPSLVMIRPVHDSQAVMVHICSKSTTFSLACGFSIVNCVAYGILSELLYPNVVRQPESCLMAYRLGKLCYVTRIKTCYLLFLL